MGRIVFSGINGSNPLKEGIYILWNLYLNKSGFKKLICSKLSLKNWKYELFPCFSDFSYSSISFSQ